jgi:DNA-binding CsgD family transcriptional regulator
MERGPYLRPELKKYAKEPNTFQLEVASLAFEGNKFNTIADSMDLPWGKVNSASRDLRQTLDKHSIIGVIGELISQANISINDTDTVDYSSTFEQLSVREREVFFTVVAPHNLNKTLKEIAYDLCISYSRLQDYLDSIYKKAGVSSQMGLLRMSLGLPLQNTAVDE